MTFMLPLPDQYHTMALRAAWPNPSLQEEWALGNYLTGCTEPWNVEILAALLKASNAKTVLECGGYLGTTSAWLALTLQHMGGGTLHVVEHEAERAAACDKRLSELPIDKVTWRVWHDDVFNVIAQLPDESVDFAWVDDSHEHEHVAKELDALMRKISSKGLICGHDVHGSCNLREEFSRYPNSISLDFPKLGLAGGIGIIQV